MNVEEAIQSVDMDEVINRLNAYAYSVLKSMRVKDFAGKEPIDFVGDVLLKVIEEKRDWNKAKCSFTEFLFGCLRSEIYNFFKTHKYHFVDELPEIISTDQLSNIEYEKNKVIEVLKLDGITDDEILVFECWMDGLKKPREIAKDLGVDVKEVYNITKRLERRLIKNKTKIEDIL